MMSHEFKTNAEYGAPFTGDETGIDRPAEDTNIALVVDLDGTLVRSDLFLESIFDSIARNGWRALLPSNSAIGSRAGLKAHFAGLSQIDYARLPFSEQVLASIVAAKDQGRKVYLATAANRQHAEAVAAQMPLLLDGIFASDEAINLKGQRKADALIAAFGRNGFDYIGNSGDDFHIWPHARTALSIGLSARQSNRLDAAHPSHVKLAPRHDGYRALWAAMRPHQYAKNALIFVPALTSHEFTPAALLAATLAFIAFSLCASGVYLLNDLLDLQADRAHPSKHLRPFAAGRASLASGLALIPALTIAAFAVASLLPPLFPLLLAVYFAGTLIYSLSLKKKMIVDVVTLAILYTIRIFAGAAAIDVVVSEWLFTFSLMIFAALALTKRHIELAARLDNGLADPDNRDYRLTDLPVIAALAAAAGMNSITVLALYVSSPEVASLYSHPHILWGLCPLFLYWTSRTLMLAHRRMLHDDPITFALRDRKSWLVGFSIIAVILAAR
ncbi:UbiA family prenyltransferase [Rhizobium sp. BE258]|uniref:UbiA family prenyltransferase n=1 Tax=Rhizobium sp. BE258 TaxID=2817722 RepID=UPI00285554FF|nr:UbiA family prenyltransferase [Rhizobium sp. BE258]MDR7147411.1 4-hydroxybenzoate polyprenyltransferase/phosphoglycolate phosphatase-like HAD superfamily hydrolase [Rhizobium sp. BE258]